jgi:hypothetical protein
MALRCTLRLWAKQVVLSAPIGEARHIRSAKKLFSRNFVYLPRLPISGARIAVQIVLAQHKGHERIGEARTSKCCALPIVTELAY